MKTKRFISAIVAASSLLMLCSCNEEKILEEIPLDFYSPENSYVRPEHYEAAITHLYDKTRNIFYNNDDKKGFALISGSDYLRDARNDGSFSMGDYRLLTPSSVQPDYWWRQLYGVISGANTIIDRIGDANYKDEKARTQMIAEARFFRGFCYRALACLFGGVPLIVNEIKSPRRDLVRATREETYRQAANDLRFAAENLPAKKDVKAAGRLNSAAGYHYLAEMYLALEKYDSAAIAASMVIDDPAFGLMKDRFGSRKKDPGNAWWDLFQMGNYNLPENTEAIWVAQIEPDDGRKGVGNYKIERICGCVYWQLKDPKGVDGFIGPTTQNGGRGAGYLGPTSFWCEELWRDDWDNDQRNQEPNMIRDFVYDNPKSEYYGMKVSENKGTNYDTKYFCYPFQSKISQRGDHPSYLYAKEEDKLTGLLTSSAMKTYHDQYFARLAETYLIRAEAYYWDGYPEKAAADINVVRERVGCHPIGPEKVDIDYILDERLRELSFEEPRILTLGRLGLVFDRVSRFNDYIEGETISEYNNLYPIPYGEIETNTEAVLEQNPGYE
ncbi:MAG: RagB/SusD family nutrient uptake outer membrane protein [Bacteroidales bacterium]|nr:RagB/SusD family nutrient uptake outer membrane protein [Bacteroidales bacterium]